MNEYHAIRKIFGKKPVKIISEPVISDNGVTNRIASKRAGILRYTVTLSDGERAVFIGKRKSGAIIARGILMLCGRDALLLFLLVRNHKIFGYNGSAVRETILYSGFDSSLGKYLPAVKGSVRGVFGGECFIAMEELHGDYPSKNRLYSMIDAIADLHAFYYGNEKAAEVLGVNIYTPCDYKNTRLCLRRLFDRLSEENTAVFGEKRIAEIYSFISEIHTRCERAYRFRTLTHNDYSVRNISCGGERISIYDWELACYQNPCHDIIELIISLMADMNENEVISALDYYRSRASAFAGEGFTFEEYIFSLKFSAMEFAVNKLSILRLAGKRLKLEYTHTITVNTSRMLEIIDTYEKRSE